ncbi:MAG: hypothetical protein KC729_21150, partial [Candidatus Eisenbacteria bacterium]|nr:hypothetical protein [Candidatus Eisenbacteria bacterium]
AKLEILKMVAEGKISPEDGERLLAALREASEPGPAGSTGPGGSTGPTGSYGSGTGSTGPDPRRRHTSSGPQDDPSRGSREGFRSATENLGRAFEDAAGAVRVAAAEGVRAFHKVFDEHRPGTEAVALEGNAFEAPPGSSLRIHPAVRFTMGGSSAGGAVTVRAVPGDSVRVLRGAAVEVHSYDNEYVVTWAKSSLEIEVPPTVASLVARGIGGNVSVYGFEGQIRIDAVGGSVSVDGPVLPIRLSSVGGTIRVSDLAIAGGASTITATGGDVILSVAPEASLELRATASFGGGLELPRGSTQVTGRTRHRGTCLFGSGAGRMKVDTVAGWIRVNDPHESATHRENFTGPVDRDPATPPPPPPPAGPRTSPRDFAGEAMGDSGIAAEVLGRSARRSRGEDDRSDEDRSNDDPPRDDSRGERESR